MKGTKTISIEMYGLKIHFILTGNFSAILNPLISENSMKIEVTISKLNRVLKIGFVFTNASE